MPEAFAKGVLFPLICMLSLILNKAAEEGEFGYHPQCQGFKLTHLSFDDDILVFTNGTSESLLGVLDVMRRFATMSGLHINAAKSSIYVSGNSVRNLLSTTSDLSIAVVRCLSVI